MFTKEEAWLKKWDVFVFENPKGSHLLFSDWLASYASYGFDYEVGLVLEGDTIIGGCGVVIPKFLFFKFYIIPHGPIYRKNDEQNLVDHLKAIMKHAIDIGACYMQMSVPIASHKDLREYTYNNTLTALLCDLNIKPGKLFNYVYSSYGLNWVDLRGFKNADDFLEQLTPKVRRNIRLPYNKQASPRFLTKLTDIEQAYIIITQNANNAGYSVRSFNEFGNTIIELIKQNKAYFIGCEVEGKIRAAALFIESSGYFTNIMGGVSREKPDIKLGYMLQWEIIKKSFEYGHSGYNISLGGSRGVADFKSKFGAETVLYENPHYHIILKPFYFKLFRMVHENLKPYKQRISKILTRL